MQGPGAFGEAIVFLYYFSGLTDPGQQGKVRYRLDEVVLLCLVAALAGADFFADIARFGEKKPGLLRRFPRYAQGAPSHDQLGTIFAMLDPVAFQRCFVVWVSSITGAPREVIAKACPGSRTGDGKTSRRSCSRKEPADPLHMLSAFAAGQRMVLGQIAVDGKSNEITAIPKLLDLLSIEGAVVTIDAMGCQKKIARTTSSPGRRWRTGR